MPVRHLRSLPFLFATGIENSYPTIAGRDGRPRRIDEMEKCGHYARWAEDFALAKATGVRALRWGPPYYRVHVGASRYDWSWSDEQLARLRTLDLIPIVDLCHFGVPDWIGSFQDPAFPILFAEYARAFARRYPWVRYWTPVNEIFVCASFSALRGWWNEREASEGAFVRALRNLCMAHELAVEAIVAERPDAVIVQAESLEHFHAAGLAAEPEAARWNALRLLSLDLTTGRALDPGMAGFLHDHGVPAHELSFFRERRAVGQRWLGADYYATCEHRIDRTGRQTTARSRPLGLARVAQGYWERYRLPIFHCETHATAGRAPEWLAAQWREIERLRAWGVPVQGFTWFSLTDQIDWQLALREERDEVHPVGLYDLERRERPVGAAYRALIDRHALLQASRPEPAPERLVPVRLVRDA